MQDSSSHWCLPEEQATSCERIILEDFRPTGTEAKATDNRSCRQKTGSQNCTTNYIWAVQILLDGLRWTWPTEACRLPAWAREDAVPREEDFEYGDCRYEPIWRKISPVRPERRLLLREKGSRMGFVEERVLSWRRRNRKSLFLENQIN